MKTTFLSALAKDGGIDEPNLSVENIGKTYGPLQKQVRDSARQEQLIAEIQVCIKDILKLYCNNYFTIFSMMYTNSKIKFRSVMQHLLLNNLVVVAQEK